MVLQLHPLITPYQVAIVISSSSTEDLSSLHHVCHQLQEGFHKAGITVLNTAFHSSTLEAHLKRNDQLGIPYTVIVTNVSLTDGMISTINRDTGTQIAYHISNIVEDLSQSLGTQLHEHE